jgi:hypothetical protein
LLMQRTHVLWLEILKSSCGRNAGMPVCVSQLLCRQTRSSGRRARQPVSVGPGLHACASVRLSVRCCSMHVAICESGCRSKLCWPWDRAAVAH